MAKVMISLPDDLLASLDNAAEARGTTRSGLLQELTEEMIGRRERRRAERIDEIMGDATTPHGGDGVELLRAAREERLEKLAGRRQRAGRS